MSGTESVIWNMDRSAAKDKAGIRMWQVCSIILRSLEFLLVMGFMQGSHLVRFYCRELSLGDILVNELGDRRQEDQLRSSSKVWDAVGTWKQKPRWGKH